MVECARLIIGEERERKRERDKRSVDRLIQSNLGGREGTAMPGTKSRVQQGAQLRSRRLLTPPRTKGSSQPSSLRPQSNTNTPKPPKEFFEAWWHGGASKIASSQVLLLIQWCVGFCQISQIPGVVTQGANCPISVWCHVVADFLAAPAGAHARFPCCLVQGPLRSYHAVCPFVVFLRPES